MKKLILKKKKERKKERKESSKYKKQRKNKENNGEKNCAYVNWGEKGEFGSACMKETKSAWKKNIWEKKKKILCSIV